jgi:cytochrome c oxidase subunit 3
MTNEVLWPTFEAVWPLLTTPAGETTQAMGWQGLPLINTLILLASSVTLHFAHVAIENNKRKPLKVMLGATILLGVCFLALQVEEYIYAYNDLNLTLDAGIYGNTFFLLTGFHGMHVTLGAIILFVVFVRILKGHFTKDKHFAFQAAAWYWHFVDVVWLCLFVFVYVL